MNIEIDLKLQRGCEMTDGSDRYAIYIDSDTFKDIEIQVSGVSKALIEAIVSKIVKDFS